MPKVITDKKQIDNLSSWYDGNGTAETTNELETNYTQAQSQNSDQSINKIHTAKIADVPVDVMDTPERETQVSEIANQINSSKKNWQQIQIDAPNFSNQIKNPTNMSAVTKDIDNLSLFEKLARSVRSIAETPEKILSQFTQDIQNTDIKNPLLETANIVQKGSEQVNKGQLNIKLAEARIKGIDSYIKTGSFDNQKEIENIKLELSKIPEPSTFKNNPVLALTGQLAQQIPNFIYSGGAGVKEGLKYGVASGTSAGLVGLGVASPITATSGFGAGFYAGNLKGIFESTKNLEKGLALDEYSQIPNVKPDEAVRMAEMVGNINGAIEAGANAVLYGIGSKILGGALKTTPKYILGVIDKLPMGKNITKYLTDNADNLGNISLSGAIRKAVLESVKGVGTEVSEEFTQEVATSTGKQVLQKGGMENVDFGQVLSEASTVIAPTIQASIIPALFGIGIGVNTNIKQLSDLHEKTNIANKNSEVANDFTKGILKETDAENVYIPIDKLEKAVADAKLDINDVINNLGITTLYQQNKTTESELGVENNLSKIKVNTADWLTKTMQFKKDTGIDLNEKLNDDVVFDIDSLSNNEKKDITERVNTEIPNIIDQKINEQVDINQQRELFSERIQNELNITKSESDVMASKVIKGAMDWQVTPEEYYQQIKPEIQYQQTDFYKTKEIDTRKEFVKEIKNITKDKIFIPDNVWNDWKEVRKKNPFLFTKDKSKSSISTDELVQTMGISEKEVMDKLTSDFKVPLKQENIDNKLFEETRKYKSVEEFIKSQTSKNYVTVYHRTNENLDNFGIGGIYSKENKGEFFVSNKKKGQAEGYGKNIVELRVKKSDLSINDEFPSGEKHYTLSTKNADKYLKQKQELTDIYNQSQLLKQTFDITKTQAFKDWFGDSKVVDEKGDPLVVYHGTPNGNFETFNEGSLFTKNKIYADRYQNQGASSLSYKKTSENPKTFEAYLSIKNPFDTRNKKAKEIYKNEYRAMYAPELTKKGLVGWLEGTDLAEWLKENYPEYDGIILDEESEPKSIIPELNKQYESITDNLGWRGISYMPFFPTQIKSVENQGTFDPNNPNIYMQDTKGTTQFIMGQQPLITLFESADKSTFMHESSHIWLRTDFDFWKSGGGTQEFKNLWQDLSIWLGIKENQNDLTVEQQEKFARHFEDYLMTGKAPNQFLKTAFRQFKNWLVKIYRNTLGLTQQAGIVLNITPEVKYIFDRMLATEDEINFQAKIMNYEKTIDFKDINDNTAEKLNNIRQQAYDKAKEIMLTRLMRQEQNKQIKALKDGHRESVTNEFKNEPIFKTIQQLEDYLKGNAKELSSKFLSLSQLGELTESQLKFYTEYMMFAENLGFDAIDFANEIMDNLDLKQTVEAELDNWIKENHSELLEPDNYREEAMIALHNNRSVDVLALEKMIEKDLILKSQKEDYKNKVKEYRKSEIDFETETASKRAKELLNRLPVKYAKKFMPYFTQEREMAIKADRALKDKDYAKAYEYKSKQILNFALARESYNINKEFNKNEKYLNKTNNKDKKLFKEEKHFFQVAELLERFGLENTQYTPQDKIQKGIYNLRTWTNEYGDLEVDIAEWLLNEGYKENYKNLTPIQLNDLISALKQIQKVANTEKKFFDNDKFETVNDFVNQAIPELYSNIKEAKRVKIQKNIENQKVNTKFQKDLNKIDKLIKTNEAQLTKIDIIFNMMDGYKDNGIWQQTFIDRVKNASDLEQNTVLEKLESISKLYNDLYSEKERKVLNKYVYYPDLKSKFSKNEILAMALNLGTNGNRQNLFSGLVDLQGKNVEWNESVAINFLQTNMTKNDWIFVQSIWNLMETMKEPIAQLYRDVNGFTPQFIEAKPFKVNLQDGTQLDMKGGYYPLVEDKRQKTGDVAENLDEEPLYQQPNQSISAYTPNGHTKQRSGELYPVRLDLGVITNHFTQVIHDLEFRKVILDFNKILNRKEVQIAIATNLGQNYLQEIQEWVKYVGYGDPTKKQRGDYFEAIKSLKNNVSASLLFLRIPLLTQNIANVALYADAVDGFTKKDAFKGIMQAIKYNSGSIFDRDEFLNTRDKVYEKSASMRNRAKSPDVTLNETLKKDSLLKNFAVRLMTFTDEMFAIPMWTTAYNKKLNETGDEKIAINYADLLIERTIGSGNKYFTASKMRDKGWQSLFTMYMSFFNTQLNRFVRENGKLQTDGDYARAAQYAVATTFFVLSSALLSFDLPKEDETLWEWITRQMVRYGAGGLPIIRDFVNYGLPRLLGERGFDYSASPIGSIVDNILISTIDNSVKFKNGKIDGQQYVEGLVKSGSYVTGLPVSISNLAFNSLDYLDGMTPEFRDLWKRRPKRERD